MKKWLRRVRGAIGMGLTWALGWAIGGLLIGVASVLLPFLPWDAFFRVFDAPLPAFAVPGFFAGVFFSAVLGIAGRGRSFRELSLPRFVAWGAVGGLLLILFPFALVALGLASRDGSSVSTAQILAVITGPFLVMSAASAFITLKVARIVEGSEAHDVGEDPAAARLSEGEARAGVGYAAGVRDAERSASVPRK